MSLDFNVLRSLLRTEQCYYTSQLSKKSLMQCAENGVITDPPIT